MSELTREQVERECQWLVEEHCTVSAEKWRDTDAAQRRTIEQQAQEMARLEADLEERRTMCRKATQAIIDAIGSDGPENVDHAVARLIAHLAMAQARVRELEGALQHAREDF